MSILVSAKYPTFDLSGGRVTPMRVESESRASCPTLFEKMNRTKRVCSGKELACVSEVSKADDEQSGRHGMVSECWLRIIASRDSLVIE